MRHRAHFKVDFVSEHSSLERYRIKKDAAVTTSIKMKAYKEGYKIGRDPHKMDTDASGQRPADP